MLSLIGVLQRPKRSRVVYRSGYAVWVVVKSMVPFWVLIPIWHRIFRVPKKGP